MLKTKRVYEPPENTDGYRILVDRLWPRGIKKEDAHIDKWLKEIAPSTPLRKWFNHEPEKWNEFKDKYRAEVLANPAFQALTEYIKTHKKVTLLYAAKDEQHNQAVVLLHILEST